MFRITENHFLFVGIFDWGNAETQTFSVFRNRDGFALAESRTRKSGTVAPLVLSNINPLFSPSCSLTGVTNSSIRPHFSSIFPKIFNLQICYIHHWNGILDSFCLIYYIKFMEKWRRNHK